MGDENKFQKRIQKIGGLVQELDTIADPAARATTKELVQLFMELHSTGLERLLDVVFQSGDAGSAIIDELGRDSLVGSLLILYGLHPEELRTRIDRKLEQLQPKLRRMSAEAALISADGGNVRLRVTVEGHACGSTAKAVQSMVEEAIYEAAPDLQSLSIEGLEAPPSSGFIAVESLFGAPAHGDSLPAHVVPNAVESVSLSEGMD